MKKLNVVITLMSSYFGPRILGEKRFLPDEAQSVVQVQQQTTVPAAQEPAIKPIEQPCVTSTAQSQQPVAKPEQLVQPKPIEQPVVPVSKPAATQVKNSPIKPPSWIFGQWSYVSKGNVTTITEFTEAERFEKQLDGKTFKSLYSDMRSFRRSEVMFKYNKEQ
jgi:hypothetical protein